MRSNPSGPCGTRTGGGGAFSGATGDRPGLVRSADHGTLFLDEVGELPAAMRALLRHDWPHNIRELEKTLQRAVALSADGLVELPHLPGEVTKLRERGERSLSARPPASPSPSPPPVIDEEDRALHERLIELLTRHHGNVRAVAAELGKQRTQVYRWAERLGSDLEAFRK
jgi:DNA-binding NtrC family response regulator